MPATMRSVPAVPYAQSERRPSRPKTRTSCGSIGSYQMRTLSSLWPHSPADPARPHLLDDPAVFQGVLEQGPVSVLLHARRCGERYRHRPDCHAAASEPPQSAHARQSDQRRQAADSSEPDSDLDRHRASRVPSCAWAAPRRQRHPRPGGVGPTGGSTASRPCHGSGDLPPARSRSPAPPPPA
jgi:hypothetical protein